MPVLSFDETEKRFILPSTEKDSDQAWVEMLTYPLCADDYAEYYDAYFYWKAASRLDPGLKQPVLNQYVVTRRVTKWNYTDANGAPMAVTVENVKHLKLKDISFLMEQIQTDTTEAVTEEKKEISSTTSSPMPTESQ